MALNFQESFLDPQVWSIRIKHRTVFQKHLEHLGVDLKKKLINSQIKLVCYFNQKRDCSKIFFHEEAENPMFLGIQKIYYVCK